MTTKVTIKADFAGRVVHVKPQGGERTILTPENPSVNLNLHDGTVTIFEGATFEEYKARKDEAADEDADKKGERLGTVDDPAKTE